MGFIDHQSPVIIEKRPHVLQAVSGVCQQIVVIANLDENLRTSGFLQILMITAGASQKAFLWTDLGNADLPPVKSAEAGHGIQIVIGAQREKGFALSGILLLLLNGCQPLGQPGVADKAFLSLADHRPDGFLNNMVFQKNPGQEWDIFPDDSVLQGNAGGGDHHRLGTGRTGMVILFE